MTTQDRRTPRRRTAVALAVVLAVLGGYIIRLVDIQVVNARDHVADSMEWAFTGTQELYGTRGPIVDEEGQTLASSILLYDCQLDPLLITQTDTHIMAGESEARLWQNVSVDITSITGQTVDEVRDIVSVALAENPKTRFASLKNGVDTEQYRALIDLAPYVQCLPHPARAYPNGAVAGNLVGFVSSDGEALEGLEKQYDDCVASTNGTRRYQQGKDGVIIPGTMHDEAAVDGGTLRLTVNRDLQWYLQQLIAEQTQNMGAQAGAILVYEANTGKVRAAAEYPTVDPNNVTPTESDDRSSRIFRNWFEPGSPFKALAAATLLEAGELSPTSTVVASGFEQFRDGARVRDSFQHPAYAYTLAGVLIDSSNTGISKFSDALPIQTRYDYLKRFGIGDGTGSYPEEQRGLVHAVSDWDAQTAYNTSFGQGLTSTVPELARAYGAIVNGGVKMPFSLVESCTTDDGTVIQPELPEPERVISESTSAQMRTILENVFLQAPYASRVTIPGYRVGGKSGTGEKADPLNGGYMTGVYFTTMVGFAPADAPEFVVVVTLDEPTKETSSAANADAFQKAMAQVLKTYRVMPSTSVPEKLPKFG
ncbi:MULTISPECIES: peptidoglycan D,D-transpeptidase FtsI family protein [Microbacterium]|uniref:Penicillin-binding protein 2 n=1 Tax=Microbacterium wangchenii TaxID=2541726 RepID=A0ABX5SY62_9MICO|nr:MULTISPECIES: penicillin-binding protein 2 [Microbacterium]MCK6068495.1 penicillin-binding protein 2 [Microbacterium sp. EYE_512]QBR90043.1 penicillin-binding protein 2 [Microbacterium wangchenii]TXK09237.1 penicillin-binding protein 2 [Microbacterium wangchenii]